MHKPFFSIITPVYNASKYLEECIESVLAQDYKDWELILIDDGSTDESGAIIDKYASEDERIIPIHQKNAGAFLARIAGINKATGEYYVGLDADDLLTKDCLQVIYDAIDFSGCDLISYGRATLRDSDDMAKTSKALFGGLADKSTPLLPPGNKYTGEEFLYQVVANRCPSPWDKAIRMECVKRADYSEAPADACISLDSLTIIPALCEVKTVYVISDSLYLYRIVENSISHTYNINKALDLHRIYEYDEKKYIKYGLLNDELKRVLYRDFLRNILIRGVSPYKQRRITKEQLASVRDNDMYKRAKEYENLTNFSLMDLRKLYGLRKGIWWII